MLSFPLSEDALLLAAFRPVHYFPQCDISGCIRFQTTSEAFPMNWTRQARGVSTAGLLPCALCPAPAQAKIIYPVCDGENPERRGQA